MEHDQHYDAVVIGAGFGGIGAALSLAEKGLKVGLFESLRYPGGCAGTFSRNGFKFEAGATLSSGFGQQQLFKKWIDRYQLDIKLEWMNPVVHFRTASLQLDIPSTRQDLVASLCALPNAPQNEIKEFFHHQGLVAEALWALFDDPSLLPPWQPKTLLRHIGRLNKYYPVLRDINHSLADILKRYHLENFQPLRVYLDALCQITVQCNIQEAEAPFALSTMDYYSRGTAHVIGGLGKLAEELCRAIELCGGHVHLSNRVKSIKQSVDGGYELNTRRGTVKTKVLIANLLPQALKSLLPSQFSWPRWGNKLQDSVMDGWGATMLYMVAESPSNSSGSAEHWQLVDSEESAFIEGNHVFCSTSSLKETDRAPFGSQTLTLSSHVPMRSLLALNEKEQGEYIDQIQMRMRETFKKRCPEWSDRVYFAMTASPRTFERFTGRSKGLVGGIPKIKGLHNYMHLGPRKLRSDFYLVGDSTFPGQSTLATATGGERVAESILRNYSTQQTLTPALLPSKPVSQ